MRCFLHLLAILYFASIAVSEVANPPLVVQINSGRIQGYRDNSQNGKEYFAFQAIPYAKPPVDALRFKAPQPAEKWNGVLDGTKDGTDCPQWISKSATVGQEDCLHLNVYTPQLKKDGEQLLPVLFWIHGGGFMMGSGRKLFSGPEYYMDYPIVLVSINYRLGALGFLSTGEAGNYGMLDQVLAMKWTQENILNFGGDPNKVTIFGLSAGSAAVVYHLLSPLSSGLFHKAIAQSGSVFSEWPFITNPLEVSKKFAKHLNCSDVNDAKKIEKCLQEKPWKELVVADRELRVGAIYPNNFAPTVEGKGGSGFLTENPRDLLRQGKIANKVPTIIGRAAEEGYSLFIEFSKHFKSKGKDYYEREFPNDLPLFTPIQPYMKSAIKAIADEYYADVNLDDEEVFTHVGTHIHSDATFHADIALTTELLAKAGSPTYAYVFDHLTENCVAKFFGGVCGKHCSHGDEGGLQFRMFNFTLSTPEDKRMADILNGLWVSFASDSELKINDDQVWPMYKVNDPRHVLLTLNSTIKEGPLSDKITFWEETIPTLMKEDRMKDELNKSIFIQANMNLVFTGIFFLLISIHLFR